MNDREALDPIDGLPAELAELDAELGAIRMAERASFGPELHAELLRQRGGSPEPNPSGGWIRPTSPGRWAVIAASFAALLFAVAAPPAAVTSFSVIIERLESVLPTPGPLGTTSPVSAPLPTPPAPRPTLSTVGTAEPADPFRPVRLINPHAIDVAEAQNAIRRLYPRRLQRAGIGGIVNVQFHVDSTGAVIESIINQGSGVPQLDKAALDAAPLMRFQPATWDGRPFSTWVTFDIVFEPSVDAPPAGLTNDLADERSLETPYELIGYTGPSPIMQETLELLQAALGDSVLATRLGGIDGLAHGEPPIGSDPFAWRERAGQALESAMRKAPDNPAPFLALARIRRKQGLPDEARSLLDQGIHRAEVGGITVSPRLTAELRYEMAGAARESWRPWEHLGKLPADALPGETCARARTVSSNGEVTPETLIAWNYVCPEELRKILDTRFEDASQSSDQHDVMLRSLRAAVAADPGHVRANVDLLLDLAERDDKAALLNDARRFALESSGHPYARLLTGVALESMGRPEEAFTQFQLGLSGLPPDEADRIRDIRPLLDPDAAARFAGLAPAVRAQAEADFWLAQDPLRSTEVNERLVAHIARSVYAYFRLGGSQTDAGNVWVRYGEPLQIRSVGEGTALRTELWDYGSGPAVTFRRPAASTTLDLTPEGRAYLADLRTTRPRAYGSGGRVIDELSAEVSRFRDPTGAMALDVTARVPETLKLGDQAITVTLIQLDARGHQVAVQDQKLSPTRLVRMQTVIDPATREVAVEMLGSSVNRAAALRVPIDHRTLEGGGPSASDPELVKSAVRPRRGVPRQPELFEPLADHTITTPDVGLVLEFYNLPSPRPYALRVELAKAGGGSAVPLAFRPSGESGWGTSFSRTPWPQPARSTEYLNVRLGDAAPGRYTLRVIATLEDGSSIISERPLDRK